MSAAPANTRDCFARFLGQRVIGVMFDTFPLSDKESARGSKTFIFEDGYALTIASAGSYWVDYPSTVKVAIRRRRAELEQAQRELEGVLAIEGVLDA